MKRATRMSVPGWGLGLGMFTPGNNDVLGLADAGVDGDSVGAPSQVIHLISNDSESEQ